MSKRYSSRSPLRDEAAIRESDAEAKDPCRLAGMVALPLTLKKGGRFCLLCDRVWTTSTIIIRKLCIS